MKKLGQHLLDPTTEIKVGTLVENGATRKQGKFLFGMIKKSLYHRLYSDKYFIKIGRQISVLFFTYSNV